MEGILRIFLWDASARNDLFRQSPGIFVNIQHGERLDSGESHLRMVRIASARFFINQCRNVRLVLGGKLGLQVSSGFLMAGNHEIAAWPGCKVTHDRQRTTDMP
jgi:hypothetical protein